MIIATRNRLIHAHQTGTAIIYAGWSGINPGIPGVRAYGSGQSSGASR